MNLQSIQDIPETNHSPSRMLQVFSCGTVRYGDALAPLHYLPKHSTEHQFVPLSPGHMMSTVRCTWKPNDIHMRCHISRAGNPGYNLWIRLLPIPGILILSRLFPSHHVIFFFYSCLNPTVESQQLKVITGKKSKDELNLFPTGKCLQRINSQDVARF